jgi:Tfp pilus assembly protein PilF
MSVSMSASILINAKPYTPKTSDSVIATWKSNDNSSLNLSTQNHKFYLNNIRQVLTLAKQPGHSYLYEIAENKLDKYFLSDLPLSDKAWLLRAQIQQYNHQFDQAKASLLNALSINKNNDSAILMLSRIHIIQRDFQSASKTCKKLIGISDITTASICLYEAESYLGNLEESYKQLQNLTQNTAFNSDEYQRWVYLILADMSDRLNRADETEYWLDKSFDSKDLNFIIHWADNKLILNKFDQVHKKLSEIANSTQYIEDGILLRLAISENSTSANQSTWQKQIKKRIEVRERREDTLHASDIARYYLDVNPNSQKALEWAKINWHQAKEHKDKTLLDRALKLHKEQS